MFTYTPKEEHSVIREKVCSDFARRRHVVYINDKQNWRHARALRNTGGDRVRTRERFTDGTLNSLFDKNDLMILIIWVGTFKFFIFDSKP